MARNRGRTQRVIFGVLQPGDRMLLRCDGGPSSSRLVTFPPPLEIQERSGLYVLQDDGPVEDWSYMFVPHP
jgi:hypothetical protein